MLSFPSLALFTLAYVSGLVNAIPLAGRDSLDVASPPVTYPTQGVIWHPGEKQTVTWDTSSLPAQITNPTGKLALGWQDGNGLNLQLNSLLAQGFSITAGRVDITVPSGYPTRDTYIVALIGSSGNTSPTFTITSGGSSSDTVNSPSPSTSTPPAQGQSTSVPGTPTSTTPSSDSSTVNDVSSPSPKASPAVSQPHSSTSSPPSSVSSSSTRSSGTPGSSNGNTSSSNSGWVNKPAGGMVISLFAASLVTFFL